MAGSDDAFRARLLETFREEAEEYLESITAGLIDLEKSGLNPRRSSQSTGRSTA